MTTIAQEKGNESMLLIVCPYTPFYSNLINCVIEGTYHLTEKYEYDQWWSYLGSRKSGIAGPVGRPKGLDLEMKIHTK